MLKISRESEINLINILIDQDIISGKSKAKVKTKSANPVIKPGAKKIATPNAKIRSRQKAKLKESGSIDDALNLILQNT